MEFLFNNPIAVISLLLNANFQHPRINKTNFNSDIILRVILSNLSAQNSILNPLLAFEAPKIIVIGANLTDSPIEHYPVDLPFSALHFSSHMENIFVFLPSVAIRDLTLSTQINFYYKNGPIQSTRPFPFNTSPLRAHYIFVGDRRALEFVFNLEQVQVLKYKTGIQVKDESPVSLVTEKYVDGSRDSVFVETDWPEFGLIYQDKFGLVRNRKLLIQSNPTHVYYNEEGKPSTGPAYNMWRSMADHYNCSLEFKTAGWQNVRQNPNGSWNGFVGALIDNEIDIGMWLQMTYRRRQYMDIPAPSFYETFGFITAVPDHTVKWQAILHLLEPDVFIAVGVSCLLFSLMLYSHYGSHLPNVSHIDRFYFSIFSPLSFFIQRPLDLPSGTRMLAGTFLFGSIVVGVCFESNLLALLTQPDEVVIPRTAKQLNGMHKFSIDYINYAGTAGEIYLKETGRADIRSLLPRINVKPFRSTVDSLMRTALDKTTVTLNYQTTSFLAVAANLTVFPNIYPVQRGEVLENLWVGPVVRKYSKLYEIVQLNVRRLDQTGHNLKWLEELLDLVRRRGAMWMKAGKGSLYRKLKDQASQIFSSQAKPLTVMNVTFVYFCLAVGSAFALVVYCVENCRAKWQGVYGASGNS